MNEATTDRMGGWKLGPENPVCGVVQINAMGVHVLDCQPLYRFHARKKVWVCFGVLTFYDWWSAIYYPECN